MLSTSYDLAAAAKRIEELITDNHSEDSGDYYHPSTWVKLYSAGEVKTTCVPYGEPATLRMACDGVETSFRMIGVLEDMSLPTSDRRRLQPSRLPFVQQKLVLSGLTSKLYTEDLGALYDVYDTLVRMVPAGHSVDTWTSLPKEQLSISNRLFTPQGDTYEHTECALDAVMDPSGEIARLAKSLGLMHAEENKVEYLERRGETINSVPATSFRTGDIVQVLFSTALFPTGKDKFIFKLVLRGVISLDTSFTKLASRITKTPVVSAMRRTPLRRMHASASLRDLAKSRTTNKKGSAPDSTSLGSKDIDMLDAREEELEESVNKSIGDLSLEESTYVKN